MRSILEYLEFIQERRVIGFKGAGSTYGECIILAGGPGSGKGFIREKIDADFKIFDVDDLKSKYEKMLKQGKIKDELKDFDYSNPDDVTELHMRVKKHGWKEKQIDMIFRNKYNPNKEANNSKILPNLLFDRVSGKIEDITEIALRAKTLGYNVTLVWVLCNLEVAKVNNKVRYRNVSEKDVLIPNHKAAYDTLTALLNNKYHEFNAFIDTVWLGYSAGFGRKLDGEYANSPVLKIKKDENGNWIFNQDEMVDKFLAIKFPIDYEALRKNLAKKHGKRFDMTKNFIDCEHIDMTKEVV